MTLEMFKEGLMWCTIINVGALMLWGVVFMLIHDWVYGVHSKWFKLSVATFDAIHYSGMGLFKAFIFVFNIVPYIALSILT